MKTEEIDTDEIIVTADAARAAVILEYLQENPDGATLDELAEYLEVSPQLAQSALREATLRAGEDEDLAIVGNNFGSRVPFVYYLTDDQDDIQRYFLAGRRGVKSRMQRILATVMPATRGDKRKAETKEAVIIARYVSRLLEDIDELETSGW